jgi:UDP-N-acetylmuramoyl-tripeptide--D-alanyl-D-alanine ligase
VIALTLAELAGLCGGVLAGADPTAVASGPVVVDSRAAVPGAVFVATKGERVDGHDFAAEAVRAGAVAVLAERALAGVPTVVVAHAVTALGALASSVLDRLPDVAVVALTGSSGKTSTKDLVAALLEPLGPTVAPPGSYNTEIGLPLTVLAADRSTKFLVLEMGARGIGHIQDLTRIARPQIGVVLNVGSAHLGEFGSREAIAAAKAELVEALPADGLAVLNAGDPLVASMARRTSARVVFFGASPAADVRADALVMESGRARFQLVAGTQSAQVHLGLVGEHQVSNCLAAAAVALELGAELGAVAAGLSAAVPRSRWRMEVTERADGVTVVNDAYNANPESVRAALRALADLAQTPDATRRRTWAVLGEMRELGAESTSEHDAVGRLATRTGIDRLVVVGQGARATHLGAGLESSAGPGTESAFVPDAAGAVALLLDQVRPGDVVLVKASRAAGLERVAEALLDALPSTAGEPS